MIFPDWQNFTPTAANVELERLIVKAEKDVAAIEAAKPTTYEDLVWALDDATDELWHAWGRVSHMLGVANTPEWRKLEEEWQPKIVAFSLRVGQSKPIYESAKSLAASAVADGPSDVAVANEPSDVIVADGPLCPSDTKATRRRIVAKMIESAELAGVGLDGTKRERFNTIQARLAQLGADFHNAVIDATTPEIADATYVDSMKHEQDRAKREALYRKRSTRAPENAARIDEILALRRELAEILGFRNYAELSLKTKCAPSVAAVLKMIDELDEATVKIAAKEEKELAGDDKIEPWDVAYLAERLREKRYAYSEDELKKCFKFPQVLAGLFKMVKFLFDVEVREIVGDAKPSIWHKDVRFFEVSEKGKAIANFYLDPYVRPGEKSGGAWMNEFANRSDRKHRTPLAVVVLNLKDDDMPLREVETLFHEFGHALQCMLTRVGEEDAAGINLIEWDAVEVASQFMENWCLDDRTGIAVPPELKAKVRAAKNFRAASVCRRQLAFAKLDIGLHDGTYQPSDKAKVFAHFGLPMIAEDKFLCAFTHIFAGGYAAGYYGYKWAEVMSADCYGAFEEAGLSDDNAVKRVGNSYRETILALGGSKSAIDVFREFRKRDPEITAMLRQQGLLDIKTK